MYYQRYWFQMKSIMISGDQLTFQQFQICKDLLIQEEDHPSKKVELQHGGMHVLMNGFQVSYKIQVDNL